MLYTLLLLPLSLVPWWIGFSGPIYGVAALVLGAGFLFSVLARAARQAGCSRGQPDRRRAGAGGVPLLASLYLFVLFAALAVDRLVG